MTPRNHDRDVKIRVLRKDGATLSSLADRYGITRQRVHQICDGVFAPKEDIGREFEWAIDVLNAGDVATIAECTKWKVRKYLGLKHVIPIRRRIRHRVIEAFLLRGLSGSAIYDLGVKGALQSKWNCSLRGKPMKLSPEDWLHRERQRRCLTTEADRREARRARTGEIASVCLC